MTTRAKPINDYQQLAARFSVVRRSWKRAAALSGLAVVVTEGIGLFTVLLFLDWLYQPQPVVRLGLWAVALAGLAWLVARHVVKPLLRRIPDEQIALYIEEHRAELDGVLITAAEYYRKRDGADRQQGALIDAVINQATQRSARTPINRIADLSRLKKYGIGALAGIGIYVVLGIIFPGTVGHHLGRVLAPWHATDEDLANHAAAALAGPMRFTLSKGDTNLVRGSSFDFEATLSKTKPADQTVVLNFRPKAGGDWQKLPMTEIEKLNGFQGSLPDVSEDLEFFVSCGPDKSDTYNLTVYDPLIVQSLETTTHYPDYLKLPDLVVRPSPGDVTAVIGSAVTLRILTSTPLKEGQIKWSDGRTQSVTVDPQAKATATVSFPVTVDGTYDYTLTDVNGQQAVSAAPLSIHAVPDAPPTITIKAPQSPVLTHMLGEVNFQVEAGDDFGVQGVDFVYSRLDSQGQLKETRLPLSIAPAVVKDAAHGVQANYRFMLEDAQPPFQPNDAITYHFEARDAKGQKAISEIGFIIVGYFESWGTWAPPDAGAGVHDETGADLMALVALVWELNNNKPYLKPDELQKKSQEIAGKMVDSQGNMLNFITPHVLEHMPLLVKVEKPIAMHIKNAHDALVAADTATATAEMSTAAALFTGYGIKQDTSLDKDTASDTVIGSHFKPPALTMLEQARLDALAAANKDNATEQDSQAQAQASAETAQKVADILAKQDALIAKAQNLVNQSQKQGTEHGTPDQPALTLGGAGGAGAKPPPPSPADAQKQAADLAAAQHDLAQQTQAAAQAAKAGAAGPANADNQKLQNAADKAAGAARMMEEAARAFAAGKNAEGQDKAAQAKLALQDAGTTLQNNDRDKLEAAISAAESHAAVLLDKQKDLNADTAALAKDIGTKTPDQRQQRDLQKMAYQQTQLGADADALHAEIDNLNQWAQQVVQPEATRALGDAQHVMKRSQLQTQMSGAVVDLNNGNPGSADAEQKTATDALAKIVDNLNAGSDALAASREAQLNRANRVAQEAKKGLAALQGQNPPPAGTPATDAGAKTGQDNKPGGAQPGEQGKDAQGAQAQTGQDNKPGGEQAGHAQAGQPGNQAGTQPDGQGGGQLVIGAAGREDEVRKLAYNLTQLTAVTDNRQLIPQDQVDQLKEMSMDPAALEKKLMTDPKFLQGVAQVVGDISEKIEAELQAKSQEGKLFSSQREECPPGYRQFVNQYFEALSQVAPKTGQAPAPAPAGQP